MTPTGCEISGHDWYRFNDGTRCVFCRVAKPEPEPLTMQQAVELAQARDETIEARFLKFHAAHPEVYDEIVALARFARRNGRTKQSIKQLFEQLRWQRAFDDLPEHENGFKLSNNHHSRYARLIMENEADLTGVFTLRPTKRA